VNLSESYRSRLKELAGLESSESEEMVDVSCAALANIEVDGRYLLFKEKKKFQPIGGGLKYYDSALPFLESIEFQTERTDNDIRIRIPVSNWETFKKWFYSEQDREVSIDREIDEEISPFLGSQYTSKMNTSNYKVIEQITNKNRIFQIHKITFPEDVKQAIINLVNTNEQFILATPEEMKSSANNISDHSQSIL
jgi:hypothetical protein